MEFLKQHLTPELYAQLETALKGNEEVNLVNLADGEFVAKRKFIDETQKVEALNSQIAERNKQIEELSKIGMTDELKQQIKDLQVANANTQKEWEAKLKKQEFDFALSGELKDHYKARDIISVLPHLKADAIKFADGKFDGLDEQMQALTKDKSFLFADTTEPGTGNPANPPAPDNGGAWDFGFQAVRQEPTKQQ
ncbi:MAG: phage scaffolding protein [Clostridia bacterium]